MQQPVADLCAIVTAVQIHSETVFSIGKERFDAPTAGAEEDLAARLAFALYSRKYCQPTRSAFAPTLPDTRAARVFVEQLSHANSGTGTWEAGWVIQAFEPDGTLVVRRKRDEFLVWATPDEFRPSIATASPAIESDGRVRVAKELREMLPGYYAAFGDADRGADDGSPVADIVRFYWHLTSDIARDWMREITSRFNAAHVPFQVKVLNDPAAYARADAGVLYIERKDLAATMALLPALHQATRDGLRTSTPMFTKRLARGVAVADDPGDGRSFGQHRCQLVAEGLVRAFAAASDSTTARLQAVVDRFADEGLSGATPWLQAGSQDIYQWPRRTRR